MGDEVISGNSENFTHSPIHPLTHSLPWTLRGSGVLLLRDWRSCNALVHYENSPVGAYDEFAVIELTLRGPRVTQILVNSESSKIAGRALWGFPKVLGDLEWRQSAERITFRRGREYFHFRVSNFSMPLRAKFWTVQTLDEKCVRVPFKLEGRLKLALRGKQVALVLENFELHVFAPLTQK